MTTNEKYKSLQEKGVPITTAQKYVHEQNGWGGWSSYRCPSSKHCSRSVFGINKEEREERNTSMPQCAFQFTLYPLNSSFS